MPPAEPPAGLQVFPVVGLGEVRPGDDLVELLTEPLSGWTADGDVLVVTQKIVSKAEGRIVPFDATDADAKEALVRSESVRILRRRGQLLITETHHGFVCANAGIDLSNVEAGTAALLPVDSDRSARGIRQGLRHQLGVTMAVIISDTFGRAWRNGVTDVAIGLAGIAGIVDLRGTADATGRILEATEVCVADEIAAAAELVMGKDRSVPAAVVRGVSTDWLKRGSVADEIVRDPAGDLFR